MRGPHRVVAAAAWIVCSACGDGAQHSVIRPPEKDAHLWDTEDPGAAAAPTSVLLFAAVVGSAIVLTLCIRSRRDSGPIRLTRARRTKVLVLHRPVLTTHAPGDDSTSPAKFPAWVSEKALAGTVERIANDARSYASAAVPTGPGLYVAQVRMAGPAGVSVIVKVVVDPAAREVVAAHPSRGADRAAAAGRRTEPGATTDDPTHPVRALVEQARASLPAGADAYAMRNPHHPDSIATLAYVQELIDLGEWEVALYAIAAIARDLRAGPDCGRAIDAAARAMSFDARQLGRIALL